MLTKEVGTIRQILKQAGRKVFITKVSGEVIKTDSLTVIIEKNLIQEWRIYDDDEASRKLLEWT